ncbi:MAG: phosphatase PAP2 family protein, partial [Deltaproteobacteria bacterium]
LFLRYSLAFLMVNLIGFTVYYLHPAAPPWYVAKYGFEIRFDIPGNAAGLARVDTWLGVNLFTSIYSRVSNVFAPLPSLHCAYPFVVLCYVAIARQRLFTGLAAVFMLGIFFAAVYTGHHYFTDLICGVTCAIVSVTIIELVMYGIMWFRRFMTDWKCAITAQ